MKRGRYAPAQGGLIVCWEGGIASRDWPEIALRDREQSFVIAHHLLDVVGINIVLFRETLELLFKFWVVERHTEKQERPKEGRIRENGDGKQSLRRFNRKTRRKQKKTKNKKQPQQTNTTRTAPDGRRGGPKHNKRSRKTEVSQTGKLK